MTLRLALMLTLIASPALAQPRAQPAPAQAPAAPAQPGGAASIGKFQDWEAATFTERGAKVCYAFTRATRSVPAVQGRKEVVLTVTHRPGARDQVAITAGYAFPASAEPSMIVEASAGNATLAFFTSGESAFGRDGRAAVAAFQRGREARMQAPGPRGGTITDTFSLTGFSAAYKAISDACK